MINFNISTVTSLLFAISLGASSSFLPVAQGPIATDPEELALRQDPALAVDLTDYAERVHRMRQQLFMAI